jgi:PAS domain S-box-containing protein
MARLTLESGKVYEIVQQSQDGRTFPVEASTRLIEIEGRQLFQSIVRNITRRKEAEASLSESEKRYRLLVENAPVGIYTLAADTGYFTTLNPAFEKITGWSCSEWLGKPFIPLVHPEDLPQAMNRFRRVLDGEEVLPYEIRIASKKGDYLIIEIFNTPQMEKGQVVGVVGIGRDVTDRKRTEEALAAEKELLSVTLRSIGDGVISTDIESRIVLINKVAEELTGWHQEEVMGKPLSEVFHIVNEKTRQSRQNPVEKVVQTGSIVTLANGTRLIARNGRERIIEDSGAPIRDREGRIRGVVLVFRDITEKQKIEEELFKAEKLDSIGLLAGGIAHDFNNLLTAILGNLSLAKSSVSPEDRIVKRLIEAEKATLRAKDLTQQLLTFAKGGEPIKQTASLPELIIETANFALRGAKVKCRFSFPENLWKAEIDVGQISQVIHNLILNADQAMPEGGAVLIRVENVQIENDPSLETGNYIRISIQDQGKGIPEEILPKIYDPYFTTKPEGSGLGLATAYSIIHRHEGAIQAVTKEGTGTIFDILLPATQNVANKSVLVKSRGGSPILGKGRILVMDDEAIVGAVVGEMLDYLGYSFELVRDGWEAIKKYESALAAGDPFQAVLLDLTVPGGLGGKEALQSLLAIDPDVRAIVSSGYSSDPVLSEFKKYGFQGMVAKPFRTEDLSQTLSQILSLTPRTT